MDRFQILNHFLAVALTFCQKNAEEMLTSNIIISVQLMKDALKYKFQINVQRNFIEFYDLVMY